MSDREMNNPFRVEVADLHIPRICEECGGEYRYNGIGEYVCTKCGNLAYDDYGKVRNYLEIHPGATATEVEAGTGVTKMAIRRLLNEERINEQRARITDSDNAL